MKAVDNIKDMYLETLNAWSSAQSLTKRYGVWQEGGSMGSPSCRHDLDFNVSCFYEMETYSDRFEHPDGCS